MRNVRVGAGFRMGSGVVICIMAPRNRQNYYWLLNTARQSALKFTKGFYLYLYDLPAYGDEPFYL
jgi:hypothetical protein